jgi:hypothetical protein
MKAASSDFAHNIFINCPIDPSYDPLFHAMVFTIHLLGFRARCSREENDSGRIRLGKIIKIISSCKFAIHDISRTELEHGLPRFNMPFELGIDLGIRECGSSKCRKKVQLILDKTAHRYQKFLSDIGGQDIDAHHNRPGRLIKAVRNWLRTATGARDMPSGKIIHGEYRRFLRDLPQICAELNLDVEDVTFPDYSHIVARWLKTKYKPQPTGKRRKRP